MKILLLLALAYGFSSKALSIEILSLAKTWNTPGKKYHQAEFSKKCVIDKEHIIVTAKLFPNGNSSKDSHDPSEREKFAEVILSKKKHKFTYMFDWSPEIPGKPKFWHKNDKNEIEYIDLKDGPEKEKKLQELHELGVKFFFQELANAHKGAINIIPKGEKKYPPYPPGTKDRANYWIEADDGIPFLANRFVRFHDGREKWFGANDSNSKIAFMLDSLCPNDPY